MRMLAAAACLCLLAGCPPMHHGGDDTLPDLALVPADLRRCDPHPDNLLQNPSFEQGGGSAHNTGQPPSSIPAWDGCCNLEGQGLTTTWQVTNTAAHCGAQSVLVRSIAARGDVLNQELTVTDGAGRSFGLTAQVLLREASPGAQLQLDLFDRQAGRVLRASAPLSTPGPSWVELSVLGQLPGGAAPRVQARLLSSGTLTALLDDVTLLLR
ncbi:MAG: hypothetical protein RMK29_19545 [Myxococcales bacterium]|nr:hypothetical protein [Myxococcota bacterium]MDW8283902.1 hypothetical protein [Myxococcales bacterium]